MIFLKGISDHAKITDDQKRAKLQKWQIDD